MNHNILNPLPITFEEYKKVIFDSLTNEEKEDIKNRIIERYNPKRKPYVYFRQLGLNIIYKDFNIQLKDVTDEHLVYSFEKLKDTPEYYLRDAIGMGRSSICFEYDDTKVKKLLFGNTKEQDKILYHKCLENTKYSLLPKVYEINGDEVILEKLITHNNETLSYWLKKIFKYKMYIKYNVYIDIIKDIEFLPLLKQIKEVMVYLFGDKNYKGDMYHANFGIREGPDELVWFDIVR